MNGITPVVLKQIIIFFKKRNNFIKKENYVDKLQI